MKSTYLLIKTPCGSKRIEVEFSAFPDGDIHCVVPAIAETRNKEVMVVTRLYPDQNVCIMRLLLLLDLLVTKCAKEISVFCPYLPYSRQDKRHTAGEVVSSDTICRLLSAAGCSELFTIDCHFMKGKAVEVRGGLRINNTIVGSRLVEICKTKYGCTDLEVIGPDEGSQYLVREFGGKHMLKTRGEYAARRRAASYREITSLKDAHLDINTKNILILDDMISTGATLKHAVQNLRKRGVKGVYYAATHGLFLEEAYETFSNLMEGLVFSDSVEHAEASPVVEAVLIDTIIPNWLRRSGLRLFVRIVPE